MPVPYWSSRWTKSLPDNTLFAEVCAALESRLRTLPDKPRESAATTLATLWHLAAGNPLALEAAAALPLPDLDSAQTSGLHDLVEQRVSGVPLAYLTGVQRFMGLDLVVTPDALIPRVETEILTGGGLSALAQMDDGHTERVVLDVCTGAGNVALAIAHHFPRARVYASDISEGAVALARRNATHLGLAHRVEFRSGDLLAAFDDPRFHGAIDLVVGNPPYISSKRVDAMPHEISAFEPRMAFDGGELGVRILQRLIRDAPRFLRPGGWLGFEVGLGQGPAVLKRLRSQTGFTQHRSLADESGVIRAVMVSQ
jgi:release factor glutamine methyltransferase